MRMCDVTVLLCFVLHVLIPLPLVNVIAPSIFIISKSARDNMECIYVFYDRYKQCMSTPNILSLIPHSSIIVILLTINLYRAILHMPRYHYSWTSTPTTRAVDITPYNENARCFVNLDGSIQIVKWAQYSELYIPFSFACIFQRAVNSVHDSKLVVYHHA